MMIHLLFCVVAAAAAAAVLLPLLLLLCRLATTTRTDTGWHVTAGVRALQMVATSRYGNSLGSRTQGAMCLIYKG